MREVEGLAIWEGSLDSLGQKEAAPWRNVTQGPIYRALGAGQVTLPWQVHVLSAQPNNSCCRLESHSYCQILLAKCVPCVPLTFTTAGKCLVINQNIKDEWSSLAVSCSHYHSQEMNVPSKISISQLQPAHFSWEPWLCSPTREKCVIYVCDLHFVCDYL